MYCDGGNLFWHGCNEFQFYGLYRFQPIDNNSQLSYTLRSVTAPFLSPVATKLRKGDIGLPFVRPSVRPFALNLLTHNNPPLLIGFFYGTTLSDGGHLSVTRTQFFLQAEPGKKAEVT